MSKLSRRPGGTFYGSEYGQGPGLTLPSPTPIVKKLLLIHFVGYLLAFVLSLINKQWAELLIQAVGLYPPAWSKLFPFEPVWQLGSYALLHDVNTPFHVLQNLLYLYFFGTLLEGIVGSSRFLVAYVLSILLGGLLWLLHGTMVELGPAIGASGGVFGVLVAAAALQPNAQVFLLFIPVKLKWLAIGLVGIEVLLLLPELTDPAQQQSGIAHVIHLGGALWGFVAVKTRWIWIDPMQRLSVRRAIKVEEQRLSDEQRVDGLLEKINREGMNSLTRSEREFLKKVSARR